MEKRNILERDWARH
jgi:hypothetical protein